MSATARQGARTLARRPVFPSDFRMLFRGLARVAVASSFGLTAGCAQHALDLPDEIGGTGSMDANNVVAGTGGASGQTGGTSGTGAGAGTSGQGGASGTTETVGGTGGVGGAGGAIGPIDGGPSPDDAGSGDEWAALQCGNGGPALTDISSFAKPIDAMVAFQFWRPTEGFGEPMFDSTGIWPASVTERVLYGSRCAGATDTDACNAAFDAQTPTAEDCENDGACTPVLLATAGDEVSRIEERAALLALLGGAIDAEQEAMLALILADHDLCPPSSRIRPIEVGGYEVAQTDECDRGERIYNVSASGNVEYVRSEGDLCVAGRKPAGLQRLPMCAGAGELGAYLASAAHLEAASVHAFVRIADELQAFCAPQALIAASWQAARDEIVHTHAMGSLAARFGGVVEAPVVPEAPQRDAFAFALENAVEGCVRETYGALLACYQAEAALDRDVKATMAVIAEDETRHAQLAWRIAAWLEPQLDGEQQAALVAARGAAFITLRGELAMAMSPAARAVIGAPDASASIALLEQLGTALALHA